MKRSPQPPKLDPDRLARIRARVLVTVTAGAVAAGCNRSPDPGHAINEPVHVNQPAPNTPPQPMTIDAAAVPPTPPPPQGPTPPTPPQQQPGSDSGVVAMNQPLQPPENTALPVPTANPPAVIRPPRNPPAPQRLPPVRMPPGNG